MESRVIESMMRRGGLRTWGRTVLCVTTAVIGISAQAATEPTKPRTKPTTARAIPAGQAAVQAPAPSGFTLAPAPAWVQPLAVEDAPAALPKAPVTLLVRERQTRLSDQATQRFVRTVRQVNESAGLEGAAQVEIEFDPGTQRLQWHTLAIWRGGQRLDKLDVSRVKLLHREQQLERQLVDGRLTASVVLDDVRVGDRVELAYTLVGDNPVFGGRFVEMDWISAGLGPAAVYRYRLVAPVGRNIRHQTPDQGVVMTSSATAHERETLWQRTLVPHFHFDPSAPGSVYLKDQLQLSEFADWADVARWASQLFATASQAGPRVNERAAAIRSQASDPADRLRLALDFVQTEVRYFGTEIGAGSHQPAAAEKVLVQRFGDCKDKVALLQSLLRALELTATPVLVSNRYQRAVEGTLPSPLAFDHAIIAVDLPGRRLWLDGTRSHQTGSPEVRQSLGMGFGLLAQPEANALAPMPSGADILRSSVEDRFTIDQLAGDAVLESRQTYHGDSAEWLRAMRASVPKAEFEQQAAAEVMRVYTNAATDGELVVEDVAGQNAIALKRRFRIAQPWRYVDQRLLVSDFAYPSLMAALRLPDQNPRTQAMRLTPPGIYRHEVEYRFAEPVFTRPSSGKAKDDNPFFALALQHEGGTHHVRFTAELHVTKDRVEAADWARYRDQLMKSWPRLGGTLQVSPIRPDRAEALRTKFDALNEYLRNGQVMAVTAVQRDALAGLLVLQEQIDGGRLSPKLKAQALVTLGGHLDHLDRPAEGQRAFEQAVALDHQNPDTHAGLATNALLRRADHDAITAADKAWALSSGQIGSRYTRAYAQYFAQDLTGARQTLTSLLSSRSEVERSYGPIWLYLAVRQGGDHAQAQAALSGLVPEAQSPAWPYPVLQYLRGNLSFDDAQAAARTGGKPDPGQQCELYFFAGEKARLEGDVRQARRWFEMAVETKVAEFIEHAFARRRLAQLAAP